MGGRCTSAWRARPLRAYLRVHRLTHVRVSPSQVVMVVGAGRGPIVAACLAAAQRAKRAVRMYAVEKNPNAIVTLSHRVETECGGMGCGGTDMGSCTGIGHLACSKPLGATVRKVHTHLWLCIICLLQRSEDSLFLPTYPSIAHLACQCRR